MKCKWKDREVKNTKKQKDGDDLKLKEGNEGWKEGEDGGRRDAGTEGRSSRNSGDTGSNIGFDAKELLTSAKRERIRRDVHGRVRSLGTS